MVRNLDPFRRVLIAAAQSNSKIINFSAIERDAGVSHSQAERHFEILADTMIGRYLEPFETSLRKRQTKRSKFYFFDTGVVRALTNLAGESLPVSTYEYGEIFETFLINEFFKLSEAFEKRWRFSFFKTKNDLEIDLIVEKPRGKPIVIEIKSWNKIPAKEKMSSFHKLAKEFVGSDKYVLSNALEPRVIDEVYYLHWTEGLRRIFEIES